MVASLDFGTRYILILNAPMKRMDCIRRMQMKQRACEEQRKPLLKHAGSEEFTIAEQKKRGSERELMDSAGSRHRAASVRREGDVSDENIRSLRMHFAPADSQFANILLIRIMISYPYTENEENWGWGWRWGWGF